MKQFYAKSIDEIRQDIRVLDAERLVLVKQLASRLEAAERDAARAARLLEEVA